MNNFFERVPFEAAQQIEQLSRLAFELREAAKQALAPYGVDDPQALLERIRAGELPEHPAYDEYLSARILASAREAVREQLIATTREMGG